MLKVEQSKKKKKKSRGRKWKARSSLPRGHRSLSSPAPVSFWDKPGLGFLQFVVDVATQSLPAVLPPWAEGKEPHTSALGVVWERATHRGWPRHGKIRLAGPPLLQKAEAPGVQLQRI